jgi:hypothetical protein
MSGVKFGIKIKWQLDYNWGLIGKRKVLLRKSSFSQEVQRTLVFVAEND